MHGAMSPGTGLKIRQLMMQSDDLPSVDVKIQKWGSAAHQKKKEGKWVTKHYLATVEKWTKLGSQFLTVMRRALV